MRKPNVMPKLPRTRRLSSTALALGAVALAGLALSACERPPAFGVEIPGTLRLAELSADERARLEATLVIDGVLDETALALSDDLQRASADILLPTVTSAVTAPFALDLRLRPSDDAPGEPLLLARASGTLDLAPHEENALALGDDAFDTCGALTPGAACPLLFDRNRNGAPNLEDLLAGVDPLPPAPFLDAAPDTLQFPSGIRLGSFARQVIVVENSSASAVEVRATLVGAPGVTLSRYETVIDAAEGARRSLDLGVVQPFEEAFLAISFAPVNPYLTTGAVFLEAYDPVSRVRQATRVKVIANADGELQPPAPAYTMAPLPEGTDLGGYLGEVVPFPTAELFNGLAVTGVPSSDGVRNGLAYTGRKIRAVFDEERGPEELPADAAFLVEVPPQNRLSVALAGLTRDVDLGVLVLDDEDSLQDDPAMNHRPLQSGTSPEAVELRNGSDEPLRALVVLGRVEAFPPPALPGALSASDPTPFDLQTTVSSAPEFTAPIAPLTGPIEGGNRVILTGRGFHPSATVTFADALALDCAHSALDDGTTALTCTTPPGSLLVGKNPATVVVANPSADEGGDGQAATFPEGYTYQPPAPRLDELSPRVAPTSGSTGTITLRGAFFSTRHGPPRVRFGQVDATTVSFVDASRLDVVAPPQAAGVVSVTVRNRLGTNDDEGNPQLSLPSNARSFTYIEPAGPAPQLASVSPETGGVDGGDLVTVLGSDFTIGAQVTFDGAPSGSVTFVSDTELQVRVPARAAPGVVDVEVVNDDGQTARLAGAYTYFIPSPTVANAFPAEASTTGGTFIVVSGSGFRAGVQVLFTSPAGVPISSPNVNRVSTGTLLVATPAVQEGGDYGVTVINVDGQSAAYAGSFRFLEPAGPAPRIDTIDPPSGFKEQPNLVTLTGADFRGPPAILVGSESAEVVSFTDNTPPAKDELTFYTPVVTSDGPVVVRLINSDGQSDTSVFTYFTDLDAPPQIFQVTPAQGTAGDVVSVRGSGFDADDVSQTLRAGAQLLVRGGSVAPTRATTSEIVFTMPTVTTTSPLTIEVTLVNGDGQRSSGSFLYVPPMPPAPVVHAIVPAQVAPEGGAQVTVSGAAFSTTGGRVLLAGVEVGGASFSATEVSFPAPPRPEGSYTVSVVNADGQAAHTSLRYQAPTSTTATPIAGLILPERVHALVPGDHISVTGQHLAGVTSVTLARADNAAPLGTVTVTGKSDALVTVRNDLPLPASDEPGQSLYVLELSGPGFTVTSPAFPAVRPRVLWASYDDDSNELVLFGEMLNPTKLSGATLTDRSGLNPPVPLAIRAKSDTFLATSHDGPLLPGAPWELSLDYDGAGSPVVPFPPGPPPPTFGPSPLDLSFQGVLLPADTPLAGRTVYGWVYGLHRFSDESLGAPATWSFHVEPLEGGATVAAGTFARSGNGDDAVALTFTGGQLGEGRYRVVLATERTEQLAFTWQSPLEAMLPRIDHVEPGRVRAGGVFAALGLLFPGNRVLVAPSGGGSALVTVTVPDDYQGVGGAGDGSSGGGGPGGSGPGGPIFVPTAALPPGNYVVCAVPAAASQTCASGVPLEVEPQPCGEESVPVGLGGRFTVTLDQPLEGGQCLPPGATGRLLTVDVPLHTEVTVTVVSPRQEPPDVMLAVVPGACFDMQGAATGDPGSCQQAPAQLTFAGQGPHQLLVVDERGSGTTTVVLDVSIRFENECLVPDTDGDGYDVCSGDCLEGNAGVYPGAGEVCNGIDDDCDGVVDNLGPCSVSGEQGVCADGELVCTDGSPVCQQVRFPGPEVCADGADNDCDGSLDEAGDCLERGLSAIGYAPELGPFQNPLLIGGADHVAGPISIPFPFEYFGKRVDKVWLDVDGRLLFAPAMWPAFPTTQFPWGDADNAFIAFAWGHLHSTPMTSAAWEVRGAAPNRVLVIDVRGLDYASGWRVVPSVSAQVQLQEAGSLVELHTDRIRGGEAVTQGLEGWCGTVGATLTPARVGTAFGLDEDAVRFVPLGSCGDCACQPGEETSCPTDCAPPFENPPPCGNGLCEHDEVYGCPEDCGAGVCGNRVCEATESLSTCPEDCGDDLCGNGICDTDAAVDERLFCRQDCPSDFDVDGDGIPWSEDPDDANPDQDYDGLRDGIDPDPTNPNVDGDDEADGSEWLAGRDPETPGDGVFSCGNGVCFGTEDHDNCPSDCWCGNYECDVGETAATCPSDCGEGGEEPPVDSYCGDGNCNAPNEDAINCPQDCGG